MQRRLRARVLGAIAIVALLGEARIANAQASATALPAEQVQRDAIKSNAIWAGMRAGLFLPAGGLYADHNLVTTPFRDVASTGPAFEIDAGSRFARYFMIYALFEQAFLGRGDSVAWTAPHGGQSSPSSQAVGVGLRWESNPEGWGIVADVAFAHRWFSARWADATEIHMRGPGEVRLGIGISWRVVPYLTLSPMATLATGTFTERKLNDELLGELTSSYAAATLGLSGHTDF